MRSEWLESAERDGWKLRVEFVWSVDRYRHVISAVDSSGAAAPLLESIEGSLTDDWPPSPPLQSLHLETRPDGSRVALLVGMAGKSHWSASIGPDPERESLVIDVACRTGQSSGQIGSRYRDLTRAPLIETAGVISIAYQHVSLLLVSSADVTTHSVLHVAESNVIIMPGEDQADAGKPTRRWLYRMKLSDL